MFSAVNVTRGIIALSSGYQDLNSSLQEFQRLSSIVIKTESGSVSLSRIFFQQFFCFSLLTIDSVQLRTFIEKCDFKIYRFPGDSAFYFRPCLQRPPRATNPRSTVRITSPVILLITRGLSRSLARRCGVIRPIDQ